MKTLIFLPLLLFACSKNDCMECITYSTVRKSKPTAGYPRTYTTGQKLCGDELKKLNGFSSSYASYIGGDTTTTEYRIHCQ